MSSSDLVVVAAGHRGSGPGSHLAPLNADRSVVAAWPGVVVVHLHGFVHHT